MFARLHRHFGTAGLIVAIVALVAALGGGAYAASGSSGGDGNATASATKGKPGPRGKQGKPGKAGPAGPAGPQGAVGAPGPKGDPGATGPVGSPGPEGKQGPQGVPGKEGKEGKEGSPWTLGGTLPGGKTETGAWAFGDLTAGAAVGIGFYRIPISFPIKLAAEISEDNVHYINKNGKEVENLVGTESPATSTVCTGTAAAPTATAGHLCIYEASLANAKIGKPSIKKLDSNEETGASVAGAFIAAYNTQAEAAGFGSWAVTAPL